MCLACYTTFYVIHDRHLSVMLNQSLTHSLTHCGCQEQAFFMVVFFGSLICLSFSTIFHLFWPHYHDYCKFYLT